MPEKKPARKKRALAGVLIPLLIGAVIGFFTPSLLMPMVGDNDALYFIYLTVMIAGLLLGGCAQIVIHEAGHLIFGLHSGYQFLSFNVFGLIWTRGADGKLHMKRMKIAGAGGQCLMAPPDWNDGDFPFTLYNLGGVLANLLASAVFALVGWLIPVDALRIFLLSTAFVGVAFAVMNGVPFTTPAIQNDGKNLVCIRRSLHARRAFWVQMVLAAETTCGTRLRSMPEEWFAPFPEEEMDNPIVCAIAVQNTSRLMDMLDFPAALAAIRPLLARGRGVVGLYRMVMTCDGAVCELITGRPGQLVADMDKPEYKPMLQAMKTNPSILRTRYALALLRDRDADKAAALLAEFEKAAALHPYPQDVESEREILLAIQNALLTGGNA